VRLVLPETLDITASDFAGVLRDVTERDVVIEGSGVGRVDAAGIQLVCAFVASVRARGGTVAWSSASPALSEAVRLLAVGSAVGL